jgi:hypothetical protein
MKPVTEKAIEVLPRYQLQNQKLAVRDIYDAIVELLTNSDDRYTVLETTSGRIEVDIERKRTSGRSVLRLRDFADGMTTDDMNKKLAKMGGRVSGLESGKSVRGTNSRGAKDVAALGAVRFESIASDGRFHTCEIEGTTFKDYPIQDVTDELRSTVGIPDGTGTVVSIELRSGVTVPRHESVLESLGNMVCLRDILTDSSRTVVLRDSNQGREDIVRPPVIRGKDRLKERLKIPGYPEAEAKLFIRRADKPFKKDNPRFRRGGILIKSRHGVHEATLFDPKLEHDPHAGWFFGRLVCPYLDDLWNDVDDREERAVELDPKNPMPVIDPMRKQGLVKEHPFVKALFKEVLKKLRPLVEEERKQAEGKKHAVESRKTRQRLNKLQKAAAQFMEEKQDDNEDARDPDTRDAGTRLKEKGFTLNPPFKQMVVGQSSRFWLNIRQETFPELSVGSDVQIQCLTESGEIVADTRICGLEEHPNQEGVLRAVWKVTAKAPTSAAGVRAHFGSAVAECAVEVFATEAEKYAHITELTFSRKKYRVVGDGKKRKLIHVMAPLSLVNSPTPFVISGEKKPFKIAGTRVLEPFPQLGIAKATLRVTATAPEEECDISVSVNGQSTKCELLSFTPPGTSLSIKLEDVDLGNQRYRWKANVLEIAARHPSLSRYLGPAGENFPGQEDKHFRVLLAEITADAVCSKIIERREEAGVYADDDCDFNFFSAEMSSLVTQFAPLAHSLVVPS